MLEKPKTLKGALSNLPHRLWMFHQSCREPFKDVIFLRRLCDVELRPRLIMAKPAGQAK